MNNIITFDMILELPKDLLKHTEKYNEFSEILSKSKCSKYDCKQLRENVEAYIEHYKDVKYFHKFPMDIVISSPKFESVHFNSTKTSDPVSSIIKRKVDEEIWISMFYNYMFIVASKWTLQEATYFVDAFFGNKSEEMIAEKLGICKNTLLNIKKSSLVKVWLELQNMEN